MDRDLYDIGEQPPIGEVPAKMHAWLIRPDRFGPPTQAFQKEVVDVPDIAADEVLVYVMAAGINCNNVWAGLGYDAVTLIIELVRQTGNFSGFNQAMLENPRGFTGINGIFRLRSDGTAERGLAIYRVLEGRPDLLSPAPKTFSRNVL